MSSDTHDQYNTVFSQLVSKPDVDFFGMVAYCTYKQQKVEWITQFIGNNQRPPNDVELEQFTITAHLPSQITLYKERAENLTRAFLDAALFDKLTDYQKQADNEAWRTTLESGVVAKLEEMKRGQFWDSVFAGVVTAFLVSIISIAGYFLVTAAINPTQKIIQSLERVADIPSALPIPPEPSQR